MLSDLFAYVLSLGATATMVLTLGWAAIQRGRAHAVWARLGERRDHSVNWCVAMGPFVGCA